MLLLAVESAVVCLQWTAHSLFADYQFLVRLTQQSAFLAVFLTFILFIHKLKQPFALRDTNVLASRHFEMLIFFCFWRQMYALHSLRSPEL